MISERAKNVPDAHSRAAEASHLRHLSGFSARTIPGMHIAFPTVVSDALSQVYPYLLHDWKALLIGNATRYAPTTDNTSFMR